MHAAIFLRVDLKWYVYCINAGFLCKSQIHIIPTNISTGDGCKEDTARAGSSPVPPMVAANYVYIDSAVNTSDPARDYYRAARWPRL